MNTDEFEKRLQRQPLRQVPLEWRPAILRAARASTRNPKLETRNDSWLSTLLWPHPKAWAGLAAVWILIFALHFGSRDDSARIAKALPQPSPEVIVAVRDQQKLMAELIGANSETREIERPKPFSARPHSERRKSFSLA